MTCTTTDATSSVVGRKVATTPAAPFIHLPSEVPLRTYCCGPSRRQDWQDGAYGAPSLPAAPARSPTWPRRTARTCALPSARHVHACMHARRARPTLESGESLAKRRVARRAGPGLKGR
eukprot:scaffold310_cov302-Prasinococcus_capsulatus_cf.AAC.2